VAIAQAGWDAKPSFLSRGPNVAEPLRALLSRSNAKAHVESCLVLCVYFRTRRTKPAHHRGASQPWIRRGASAGGVAVGRRRDSSVTLAADAAITPCVRRSARLTRAACRRRPRETQKI